MFTFKVISQDVDRDKLYNVFCIKTIFPSKAAFDNKIKHIPNGIKLINLANKMYNIVRRYDIAVASLRMELTLVSFMTNFDFLSVFLSTLFLPPDVFGNPGTPSTTQNRKLL